ncbi:MAG: PQQ-binding-like beta-propeller repeat protein [Planctomycetota bacterium]
MLRPSLAVLRLVTLLVPVVAAAPAAAQDWNNIGGNAQRNGLTAAYGPLSPQALWSAGPQSLIAWHPIVVGDRVFIVRQVGLGSATSPPAGAPFDAPIFALDLATGATIWRRDLPFQAGEWTTWLLGHSNGLLYAARSGDSSTKSSRVHALDPATGVTVWTSAATIPAGGPYSGCIFADNGDLIVPSFQAIWRIRSTDGATVWTVARQASTGDSCGAARFGDALYVADNFNGGQVVKRFNLATGAFQYQSPIMPGFLNQHQPMVGPDGTVYLNRASNSPGFDFFHAFTDTGFSLASRWSVPSAVGAEFGCGNDGSVYMLQPGQIVARLDAQTGAVRNTYPVPLTAPWSHFAIDADGRVYLGNGGFPTGALLAFDPDLTLRWQVPVPNVLQGGPVIAADGTLVVAGVGTNLRAYRTPSPWTNLGGGIAGALGEPALAGLGTLTAGNTVTFRASNAAPNSLGVFIFGASAVNVPIFGGTLVPSLDVTLVAAFDAQGRWSLGLPWPAGVATGASFWWQLAVLDPTAPAGLTASAGLRSVAP